MRRAAAVLTLALLAVVARADEKFFVRTSSDGLQTEIGRNTAADARTHAIRFTVAQASAERWPEAVTIAIAERATAAVWNVALSSRVATKAHTLLAPAGTYELTITAPHHRPLRRTVAVRDAVVALGTLTLVRYPMVSGVVRAADGSPIAGAFVTDRAKLSAKSDALGAFALEIDGEWPASIEVSYPGLTTKDIALPKAQASTSLPPITLFKGSRIAIALEGLRHDVEADLATVSGYKRVKVVKTVRVERDAPRATFDDVDKGKYIIVIRGGGPLQQLAEEVVVGEAETVNRTIRVDPIAVDIDVIRGDSPAAGAIVTVKNEESRWTSGDLRADSEGRIQAEAWERGAHVFIVRLSESSAPVILFDDIAGTSEAHVRLAVPDRRIAGRVVDAKENTPVANATISIESKNDDETGGTMSVTADADGRFIVEGLRDGSHALSVEAAGYVRSEPTVVRVDQTLPRRDVSLRVSRGVVRALRVVTRGGLPIRGATVIAALGGAVTGVFETDALGHVDVPSPAGTGIVAYIVPREGSFAIARLQSKTSDGEETLVVPDAVATLELKAKDSGGRPIPHLQFVMRYDGELIPPDVAELLMVRRGFAAVTGADGIARLERLPAGFLELWPVRGAQELNDIVAGGATAAPVQVALKEGLNVATMTFTRRP